MKTSISVFSLFVVILTIMLSGCSATVPLASNNLDAEAKLFRVLSDKSNIYVIRTAPFAPKLHDVTINGGARVSLAARTYTVFTVDPGIHTVAVYSTENRELMKLETKEGRNYFVEMGSKIGSGMGDMKATIKVMSESEGMKTTRETQLISSEGY